MLETGTEEAVENFFKDYLAGSEEWREMKIMVLGHGRIGKTTLVHAVQALKDSKLNWKFWSQINKQSEPQVYYFCVLKFLLTAIQKGDSGSSKLLYQAFLASGVMFNKV